MASVAEAAKHPVLRRFALRKWTLQVGGRCLALVIPDAKDWIRRGDWTAERLRGGEPPYWVQVWPAATAMARYVSRIAAGLRRPPAPDQAVPAEPSVGLDTKNRPLAGMQVLDLGCGLGIPGCVAAQLGAHVVFADKSPEALAFAAWNACQLSGQQHRQQQFDWARQVTLGRFDLMLLADVSYHAMHHGPLFDQIASCLAPGGVVLHSDPFRAASSRFLQELASRMPTNTCEVLVRQGDQATRVRMVVASACSGTLLDWSRSLASSVVVAQRQPSDAVTRSSGEGHDVRNPACDGRPEQEPPRPVLGSSNQPT